MKILWLTNTLFPAVSKELGLASPVVGGWMYSLAEALLDTYSDIELGIASLYDGTIFRTLKIRGVNYFLVPRSNSNYRYSSKLEPLWKQVTNDFNPDVIHIHGTEYPHGLAYVNACGSENVVVSIQGLVSVYQRYYLGGISRKILRGTLTFRDIIRRDSIFKQESKMELRGAYEKQLLKKVNHVIGRTSWDNTHVWANNPGANYHFCNETLRSEFYKHGWEQDSCEQFSIFLSQAHYPIKGLQQMIKAMPFILEHYPNAKVYVAGNNFLEISNLRLSGFGKYIQSLLNSNGLNGKIIFTGVLSEKEMCKRYLKSNVFVCPSSIENSPNSVGEAQLLGVPCVASYVGGISNMIVNEESGLLYPFDEIEMLAKSVCRIFSEKNLADKLSRNSKVVAMERHDSLKNTSMLKEIYNKVCRK